MISDERREELLSEIKAVVTSDQYKADIKEAANASIKRLENNARQYLNEDGQRTLKKIAARLHDATAKLEAMTEPKDIEHQKRIVASITRIYELKFTKLEIARDQAFIEAQEEVVGFLKKAGQDFAVVAARIAIKHGVAALKEGLS